ncbi:hypothetical protein GCM10023185_13910 [Hymenobacter saemangeumensis]|uniref:Uncharacterized protein n=1 Tax=Hymenobacter saemangeumensis TaxID=1084522 RepID=A0ABP8I8E0_9BACT
MKPFFLHFLSLPTIASLNRRLAGLALLWLLTLLLLNPAVNAHSGSSAAPVNPAATVAALLR